MAQSLPNADENSQGSGAGYSYAAADTVALFGGVEFGGNAHRSVSDDGSAFDVASTEDDTLVSCETDNNGGTYTLSSSDAVVGRVIVIKDVSSNAGTNSITVDTESSETIDGSASTTISTNDGVLRVYSDGTNWFTW